MSSSTTAVATATSGGIECSVTHGQAMLLLSVSLLSLCGCLYVIVTYMYVPALRQHPAGIMLGMSVYGAVYQFMYIVESHDAPSSACREVPFIVDLFLTGQETYMLIFAIDLLLALKNPFTAAKGQMKRYHIAGCVWSLIFAGISRCDNHFALFGFCWMDVATATLKTKSTARSPPAGLFFALYILLIYTTSLYAILRTWNTLLKGLPDTFTTRERIHRHLKYYVGCFVFYWTGVLITYAVYTIVPYESPHKCLLWKCLSCVLLAKGMVNSLIWTRTSNILKIIQQLHEFGHVDLPPHDTSINWALRLEILTNTTKGICESIERAEIEAIHGQSTDRHIKYTQIEEIPLRGVSCSGNLATHDGPATVLFYDYAPHIFRFLRSCASISNASYRNSLQQTTKERVSEGKSGAFFYFTQDLKYVVKTLTHEELKFLLQILPKYVTFMSANPDTFVTRFFGCHALTMYGKTMFFIVMQSVFDTRLPIHERFDLKGSWVGRLEGRKTRGTSAVCKYCGKEYIIGGSHDQLCDVRSNNGTLRHQYDNVGKDLNWNHHLKLPRVVAAQVAKQLYTDSMFLNQINCIDYSLLVGIHHRTFHVGTPSSHTSKWPGQVAPTQRGTDNARSSPTSPGGGADDPTGSRTFHNRTAFGSTRSTGPTDEGGRPREEDAAHPRDENDVSAFHHGGMGVEEVYGPGVYFMGLIDILQQWNMRKRVEHFVRVYLFGQDRLGISVVAPKEYADRFQKRVIRDLIHDLQPPLRHHDRSDDECSHGDDMAADESSDVHHPHAFESSFASDGTYDTVHFNETFLSVDPVTPRSSLNLFPQLKPANDSIDPFDHTRRSVPLDMAKPLAPPVGIIQRSGTGGHGKSDRHVPTKHACSSVEASPVSTVEDAATYNAMQTPHQIAALLRDDGHV
ncbi:hypothetical protein H310_04755 [Aphanomyces invadans]|uniref:PIPK domain-containing protein n=1 Tax=Aphanomyces invadans TaxID=157072 RepID=A0A024UF46_9STRA|nr:hypothetical protein H310_04755 [Aphanomyces invadans]ETW04492.1 hypothetical protein H310_04755 [Aphanomyces invadans]|eukprot:XP_008867448.1 hypothetical protein H310_04755 [Aphanomyces invadans]